MDYNLELQNQYNQRQQQKNNKKHKRREREQSTDNIVSKSPSIQNVIKYLQIFEHQRKETKSNE